MVFDLLKLGFSTPCYDGQYFFDTDHPVIGVNGEATSVSNFGGGSGTPWFLVDATKVLKPIIFQKRRDYQFVSMDSPNDEAVFSRKEFRYGVDARVNVGFGLWQLAYASKQALDVTTFGAAYAALMSIKGDNDKPLGIMPSLLVVPPTLRDAALTVVKAELINNTTNVQRGAVDVLVTPWLA
jgi:phage major head subunit gpT-like protein